MITFGTTCFASSVAEARVTTTLALRVVFDVDVVLFVIIVGEIKKEGDDAVSMSCIFFFSSLQLLGPSLFLFVLSQRKRHLFLSLERSTRRKNRTFSGEKENKFLFFDEETTRDTTFNSLFYSLLFEDRTLTKSIIDSMIGRVTTQCEDLSRCSSEDDDHHHRRDRQRRERVRERGKEERKKNIRKRRERRRGPKTRESDTFSSLS